MAATGPQPSDTVLEIDIVVLGHKIRIVPNVHAILALSALFLIVTLLRIEVLSHGEATPVVILEIAHFAGWAYLELPEAFIIEELES